MNLTTLQTSVVPGIGIQHTFESTVRTHFPLFEPFKPFGHWKRYIKRLDPGEGFVFESIMGGVYHTAFGWRHERIVQEFQVSFREIGSMFHVDDKVTYVPYHADGDVNHPDCEGGVVTSITPTTIFVRFGNDANSKGCNPDTLVKG
jgi:hypothetical protein